MKEDPYAFVSIISTDSEDCCPDRPLDGVFCGGGLLGSELSSLLSGLPGWLARRETRLLVIYDSISLRSSVLVNELIPKILHLQSNPDCNQQQNRYLRHWVAPDFLVWEYQDARDAQGQPDLSGPLCQSQANLLLGWRVCSCPRIASIPW